MLVTLKSKLASVWRSLIRDLFNSTSYPLELQLSTFNMFMLNYKIIKEKYYEIYSKIPMLSLHTSNGKHLIKGNQRFYFSIINLLIHSYYNNKFHNRSKNKK